MGMARLFAPVTPFFSEYVYNNLRIYHKDHKNESLALDAEFRSPSVHYLMIPETNEDLIDTTVETAIDLMQRIVESARKLRDQDKLNLKLPLKELLVVGNPEVLKSIKKPKLQEKRLPRREAVKLASQKAKLAKQKVKVKAILAKQKI